MPIKTSRPKPTRMPGIWQDGPDRFLVRVRWTDPRTGQRRKREKIASTLAEAVALKEQLVGAAPTVRPTRLRFAAYVEQWLEVHGPSLAPSTQARYTEALAHATVSLGQIYVDALSPSLVREWHRAQARRCAATTVNGWLRVLRRALDDAVADELAQTNPARAVKALPEGRTKGRRGASLSLEEFRKVIATAQGMAGKEIAEDVVRLVLTAAWTGMRRGELLALRWQDYVDNELRVERSVWRNQEKATKTDDPRRITVVEPLAVVLAEQRRWLLATQHPGLASGLIFPASPRHAASGATRRGAAEVSWYRSPTIFAKSLEKIVRACGVTEISAHSLRRTWENLLRAAGVDQLVRRAIAGWRTEKAQAIYATVNRSERDAAGDAVVSLVMGGAS